jgi:hypothetical protein
MRAPYLYVCGRTRQEGYFGAGIKVYRVPAVKIGAIPMVVFGPPAKAIEGFFLRRVIKMRRCRWIAVPFQPQGRR